MLFNIFFLSSLLPLTHELLQHPKLNYLFQTLNLAPIPFSMPEKAMETNSSTLA